jgi:hypothetical protein
MKFIVNSIFIKECQNSISESIVQNIIKCLDSEDNDVTKCQNKIFGTMLDSEDHKANREKSSSLFDIDQRMNFYIPRYIEQLKLRNKNLQESLNIDIPYEDECKHYTAASNNDRMYKYFSHGRGKFPHLIDDSHLLYDLWFHGMDLLTEFETIEESKVDDRYRLFYKRRIAPFRNNFWHRTMSKIDKILKNDYHLFPNTEQKENIIMYLRSMLGIVYYNDIGDMNKHILDIKDKIRSGKEISINDSIQRLKLDQEEFVELCDYYHCNKESLIKIEESFEEFNKNFLIFLNLSMSEDGKKVLPKEKIIKKINEKIHQEKKRLYDNYKPVIKREIEENNEKIENNKEELINLKEQYENLCTDDFKQYELIRSVCVQNAYLKERNRGDFQEQYEFYKEDKYNLRETFPYYDDLGEAIRKRSKHIFDNNYEDEDDKYERPEYEDTFGWGPDYDPYEPRPGDPEYEDLFRSEWERHEREKEERQFRDWYFGNHGKSKGSSSEGSSSEGSFSNKINELMTNYSDLFTAVNTQEIIEFIKNKQYKKAFRILASCVHPDKNSDSKKALADKAFKDLMDIFATAPKEASYFFSFIKES